MPTYGVALDTTQYVQVNTGRYPLLLQSHRDAVRVVLSDTKPTRGNTVFHILSGDDEPLYLPESDNDVWVLATTGNCSLIVTEWATEDVWISAEHSRIDIPVVDTVANPNFYYNLFSIRNTSSTVRCEVAIVNFVTDGNKAVEFVSQIDSTLAGNTAFAQLASSTILEISYDGTSVGPIAGARTVTLKTSDRRSDVRGTQIYIQPNTVFTLGVRGLNGVGFIGDIAASFRIIQEL